ncbi:MAG: hypothetical protein SPK32_03645 [Bacteroidaceae bacterium]|nr:hypothetical protein [Bacteroidaceae bacterium]
MPQHQASPETPRRKSWKRPQKPDKTFALRNLLNLIFIILAIASIVIYFALPAETRAPYFFACCFTAVLIKGVEVCIRMFSRKSEES